MPRMVKDFRLSLEIQVIYDLAINIADLLAQRDPLSESVKLGKRSMAGISLLAVLYRMRKRLAGGSRRCFGGRRMSELATQEPAPPAAQRAAGSSFYTAMRIMPRAQREAMFEIYSFCRAVDDIADNPGPRDARIAQLARWRDDIDAIYTGKTPPHLKTLAKAVREVRSTSR